MIYLDYQATTPLAPEVREAMLPWLDKFGNPHSPHRMGREAAAAVEVAREQVAALFGDTPGRLIFTSGATEAANMAIQHRPLDDRRVVTIATEHACILDTVRSRRGHGGEAAILPVGTDGIVDLDDAGRALGRNTALVCAMLINNEIGAIQPIAQLGRMARGAGALMFCDAVQGYGRVDLPTEDCDMIAISAHKIHGPKGIGALWIRDGVEIDPLLHGGGQEQGLRSGTLSPMLCAGFGAAAAVMATRRESDAAHVSALWNAGLAAFGDGWTINGSVEHRYRGNLNLRRDGLDVGRLMSELRDIAFSAGSACASGSGRPSHVLRAIGLSEAEAKSSIRIGFGRYTTVEEIEAAAAAINAAAARQRE